MLQRISGLVLSCYLYLPVTTTFLSAQNFIIPITRKYMTCRYRKRCYIDVLLSKTCCSLYVNRVSYMHMDWRLVCIFDWWRASPLRMMYIRLIGNLGRSRVLWNLNWLHMIKTLHQFTEIWLNDSDLSLLSNYQNIVYKIS